MTRCSFFLEQCPFYPNAAQMFVLESEAAGALVGGNKLMGSAISLVEIGIIPKS